MTGTLNDILGPFSVPTIVALTPTGTTALIPNSSNNTVSIMNVGTQTVTGIMTDVRLTFNSPGLVGINPDATIALVGNDGNNTVSVIDLLTLSTIGIINDPSTTIQTLDGITISPDGTKAYIENSGNNSVSIIDMATLAVTGVVDDTVAVFDSPSWITYFDTSGITINGKAGKNDFLTETNHSVKLSWTASSEGTFQIYRDSKLVGTVHGQGSLTFTDNNLKSKKTYNYNVVAGSAQGNLTIKAK